MEVKCEVTIACSSHVPAPAPVVEPHTYAKRFLKFMERVFPPSMPQQQQQ